MTELQHLHRPFDASRSASTLPPPPPGVLDLRSDHYDYRLNRDYSDLDLGSFSHSHNAGYEDWGLAEGGPGPGRSSTDANSSAGGATWSGENQRKSKLGAASRHPPEPTVSDEIWATIESVGKDVAWIKQSADVNAQETGGGGGGGWTPAREKHRRRKRRKYADVQQPRKGKVRRIIIVEMSGSEHEDSAPDSEPDWDEETAVRRQQPPRIISSMPPRPPRPSPLPPVNYTPSSFSLATPSPPGDTVDDGNYGWRELSPPPPLTIYSTVGVSETQPPGNIVKEHPSARDTLLPLHPFAPSSTPPPELSATGAPRSPQRAGKIARQNASRLLTQPPESTKIRNNNIKEVGPEHTNSARSNPRSNPSPPQSLYGRLSPELRHLLVHLVQTLGCASLSRQTRAELQMYWLPQAAVVLGCAPADIDMHKVCNFVSKELRKRYPSEDERTEALGRWRAWVEGVVEARG